MKAWDKTKWLLKKDRIFGTVRRMQNHKSNLGLMLSTLQW